VALNEGLRCKKRLWREWGRELQAFRLAPWACRRQHDLLELLDRLTPTIAELTQAIEQEVEKCPAAQRLLLAYIASGRIEVRNSKSLL
jgi:transposase